LISELNIQEYRKQIALVSQEPVRNFFNLVCASFLMALTQTLYAGTIRFNILLGAIKPESEVTQEEIETACRNANILDFILSLPEFVFIIIVFLVANAHEYSCD
jgi:ATP-binding cassette subfamily B (MDR/TAP) protein 1